MNEALQSKLSEILELGKQGIFQAADMIKEQMPDLCGQILRYEFIRSLGTTILGIVLFFVCLKLSFWFYVKAKETEWHHTTYSVLGVYSAIGGVALFVVNIIQIYQHAWLKILLAPRLFLVEYISNLIK